MKKLLEQAVVRTLTYFDIIKTPLTRAELFCYLWQPPLLRVEEFEKFLDESECVTNTVIPSEAEGSLNVGFGDKFALRDSSARPQASLGMTVSWQTKDGFYFLRGREELIARRADGRAQSERLLKIAIRGAKKIRSIPFVRAILVCNSVGAGMATKNSDVDFLIITAPKRVWLVRFFANVALLISGLRRQGGKIAGRVCLSFFIDEKNLNMAPWRVRDDDIHLAYWLYQMIPVYDPNNLSEKLLAANGWTKKYLPNTGSSYCHPSKAGVPVATNVNRPLDSRFRGNDKQGIMVDTSWGLKWKTMWEKFWAGAYGDLVEKQARAFQQSKMKFSSHGKIRPHDKSVVVGDGVIKLHETDPRERLYEEWAECILEQKAPR